MLYLAQRIFKWLRQSYREGWRKMNQKEIVLAGLAPANGEQHSPVQVQKLFFLIDKKIADAVGGPYFEFQPYNYGPFDSAVYTVLEELESDGYVDIIPNRNWMNYKLTVQGQEKGEEILNGLPDEAKAFFVKASEFVRRLSFTQLVSAIYKAYPEMRANSVFQG